MPGARVLHVVTHLDLGGAEEVAISLTERLSGQHHFTFFAVEGVLDTPVGQAMHARLQALGVPVHSGTRLPIKAGGLLQAAARLAALLRREPFDVIHLHTEIPETTYALTFPGRRAGVLRTVHNATLWPSRIWTRIGRWVEGRLGQARAVAVSQASLAGLQDFRRRHGVPPLAPDRAEVVFNGVSALNPGRRERTAGAPPRLLFAARLELQKGADLLPDLLQRATRLHPTPAEVTVLGDGSLHAALRAWADGHHAPWTVTLAAPRPNLGAHLAEYDAVLMPSRFEGFGLLAAEALLAGTPVVAFDVPGLREVLSDGYPLLAPPEDTGAFAQVLALVLQAPEHHRDLVRPWGAGVKERFSPERMAARYGQTYDALRVERAPSGEVPSERARGA